MRVGKDNKIRKIEVEYQNHEESVKRCTVRGARDIVAIHPADEIGISFELGAIARSSVYCNIHEVKQTENELLHDESLTGSMASYQTRLLQ